MYFFLPVEPLDGAIKHHNNKYLDQITGEIISNLKRKRKLTRVAPAYFGPRSISLHSQINVQAGPARTSQALTEVPLGEQFASDSVKL